MSLLFSIYRMCLYMRKYCQTLFPIVYCYSAFAIRTLKENSTEVLIGLLSVNKEIVILFNKQTIRLNYILYINT